MNFKKCCTGQRCTGHLCKTLNLKGCLSHLVRYCYCSLITYSYEEREKLIHNYSGKNVINKLSFSVLYGT